MSNPICTNGLDIFITKFIKALIGIIREYPLPAIHLHQ